MSTGTPAAAPALDPTAIAALARFGTDPGRFLDELLGLFEAEAPRLLAVLETSLTPAGVGAEAADTAHRLKGASDIVGAVTLARVCDGIEARARAGEGRAARAALPEARRQVEAAVAAARALRGARP